MFDLVRFGGGLGVRWEIVPASRQNPPRPRFAPALWIVAGLVGVSLIEASGVPIKILSKTHANFSPR